MNIFKRKLKWFIIGFGGTVAFILGVWGQSKQYRLPGQDFLLFEYAYRSFKLFMFDIIIVPNNWQLEVARWLAPIVSTYTAILGLSTLFREQLTNFRIKYLKDHVLIFGMNEIGISLSSEISKKDRVVLISEGFDKVIPEKRSFMVAKLPSIKPEVLRKTGILRAKYVISVFEEDEKNIEVAISLRQISEKSDEDSEAQVKCFIHIKETSFCGLLRSHPVFVNPLSNFELRIFSRFEMTARALFEQFPLDRIPIRSNSNVVVQVVIVGFNRMGESVLLQIARIGHFANRLKPEIIIIDPDIANLWEVFIARYPKIEKVCSVKRVPCEAVTESAISEINHWFSIQDRLSSIVVCLPNKSKCISTSIFLADKFRSFPIPILSRIEKEEGLAKLIKDYNSLSNLNSSVFTFGDIDDICTFPLIVDEVQDQLAIQIHEKYLEQARKDGIEMGSKPALCNWHQLNLFFRDANRQQADHIPVKIRAVGAETCEHKAGPEMVGYDFSQEDIEILAIMEHSRWCSNYYLAGYDFGTKRDDVEKTHPDLIPWEGLDETTKEYDREPIRMIPVYLKALGKIIQKEASNGQL